MAVKITQLQSIATPGRRFGSFVGKVAIGAYASYGEIRLYTSANWSGVSIVFETNMRATAGMVNARVWDKTALSAIAGSELSTTAAVKTRLRSGTITLVNGNEYESQFALSAGATGETWGGRLIGLPA